jgi:hypothetical protein
LFAAVAVAEGDGVEQFGAFFAEGFEVDGDAEGIVDCFTLNEVDGKTVGCLDGVILGEVEVEVTSIQEEDIAITTIQKQ